MTSLAAIAESYIREANLLLHDNLVLPDRLLDFLERAVRGHATSTEPFAGGRADHTLPDLLPFVRKHPLTRQDLDCFW